MPCLAHQSWSPRIGRERPRLPRCVALCFAVRGTVVSARRTDNRELSNHSRVVAYCTSIDHAESVAFARVRKDERMRPCMRCIPSMLVQKTGYRAKELPPMHQCWISQPVRLPRDRFGTGARPRFGESSIIGTRASLCCRLRRGNLLHSRDEHLAHCFSRQHPASLCSRRHARTDLVGAARCLVDPKGERKVK